LSLSAFRQKIDVEPTIYHHNMSIVLYKFLGKKFGTQDKTV